MAEDGGPFSPDRTCILIGSGMGAADALLENPYLSPDFQTKVIHRICSCLGTKMPLQFLSNACCAGAQAIAYGFDLIRNGYCDRVIAGGAEAFSYLVYSGFQRLCPSDAGEKGGSLAGPKSIAAEIRWKPNRKTLPLLLR